MMSVEVKQTLERGFDIVMATREIRQLTVNKLKEITNNNNEASDKSAKPVALHIDQFQTKDELLPQEVIVKLNQNDTDAVPLYIIHPIEGEN